MSRSNVIIAVLVGLLAAVVAGGGVYIWQQSDTDETANIAQEDAQASETNNAEATGEEDKTEPIVEQPTKTAEELIVEAMATRHTKDAADVDLTINENDGDHAQGLVKFTGEIAGAWWLAARTNGDWTIVADGNGVVMCSDISAYNFPTSMVPECWDETTQTNVVR